MRVVPVIGDIDGLLSGVPSLNSCTSTISNERSDANIAEFNSKAQVKVTSNPTITMLALSLLKMREDGVGTMQAYLHTIIIMSNNQSLIINTHFEF